MHYAPWMLLGAGIGIAAVVVPVLLFVWFMESVVKRRGRPRTAMGGSPPPDRPCMRICESCERVQTCGDAGACWCPSREDA